MGRPDPEVICECGNRKARSAEQCDECTLEAMLTLRHTWEDMEDCSTYARHRRSKAVSIVI